MIIERIGSGKTLEDAVASAKAMLNAPAGAEIKTEVLQTGSKGFLGFGKKDFEVKVSFDDGKRLKRQKSRLRRRNRHSKSRHKKSKLLQRSHKLQKSRMLRQSLPRRKRQRATSLKRIIQRA